MQNQDYSWILYEGSPFLPSASPVTLNNVIKAINERNLAPGYATAAEVGLVGAAIHELHEHDYQFLKYQFGIDDINLSHYLFGFTTPTILIMGGYLSRVRTLDQIVKIVCLATSDEILIELNSYKAFHLIEAIQIFHTSADRHPLFSANQIYDLCRKNPFVLDPFYLIGLEASWMLFQSLIDNITVL